MTGPTDIALPTPVNDNVSPFCKAGTGLMELFRLRRLVVAKDKSGYSPEQWRRYHEALKQGDEAIRLYLSYL